MKTKKSILTLLFLAVGVSLSGLAFGEYPAANFEPYIVYQAPEVVGATAAGSENDSVKEVSEVSFSVVKEKDLYPAAYFQPVIIYQAEEVIAAQEIQPGAENVLAAAVTVGKPRPSNVMSAALAMEESGVPPIMMIVILALLSWVVLQFRNGEIAIVEGEPETKEDPAKEVIDEIKTLAASIGAKVEITRGGQ
jgi:hypothetical protein